MRKFIPVILVGIMLTGCGNWWGANPYNNNDVITTSTHYSTVTTQEISPRPNYVVNGNPVVNTTYERRSFNRVYVRH